MAREPNPVPPGVRKPPPPPPPPPRAGERLYRPAVAASIQALEGGLRNADTLEALRQHVRTALGFLSREGD
jgi:hypothetical protein